VSSLSHLTPHRLIGRGVSDNHASWFRAKERQETMQKAQLYEAIFSVNKGIDEAVRGLEQLNRAKDSGLSPVCVNERITLFELHRASLNAFFCDNMGRSEERDVARFEDAYREYEKNTIDEIQVYRDLLAVEERRRIEGKPPRIRFLTLEEQQQWQRQYPKPPDNAGAASHETGAAEP
jgi:hypothetical protein